MTLLRDAYIELIACWAVWGFLFVSRARRLKGRTAAVVDRRGLHGAMIEGLAIAVAGFRTEWAPGGIRIAASMALAPAGVVLAWWALRHLGAQWRIQAGLWQEHRLVRSGPYRLVRHPIYASIMLMLAATVLLNSAWWAAATAAALFIAGTEMRVRAEDALLASRFGEEFERYRRSVPAYLPPVR